MAIPKSQLEAILRSLNAARFDEIVHNVGAADYRPDKLAPVQRAIWLADWAHEGIPAQREAVEREIAPEALNWPTSELNRWRAFAVERFGQIPVIGFKGQVRLPIALDRAYVPLALTSHHEATRRGTAMPTDGRDLNLTDAVAFTEKANVRSVRGVAVVGLPGCGKTTLLKHAWGLATDKGATALGFRNADLTPVLLRVARCRTDDAVSERDMLPQALRDELKEHSYPNAAEALLDGRPILWLLDGLDEAGSAERRVALAQRIAGAMDHRPDDRYVLTCRSAGWREAETCLTGRLRAFDVKMLSVEDVTDFVTRWHRAVVHTQQAGTIPDDQLDAHAAGLTAEVLDEVLTSTWLTDTRRYRMARNPLLLGVLCLVHREEGRLPESRATLYEHALRTMLQDFRRVNLQGQMGKERHKGLPFDHGCRALGAIAWGAHDLGDDEDVRTFTSEQATAWMGPVLDRMSWTEDGAAPTVADVLRRAEEDCGVLQQTAGEVWQFGHLTFQEYLAAYHASRTANGGAALAERAGQDRWEEPIRLAMSLPRVPDELLAALFARDDAPWGTERFDRLVRDCLQTAADIDPGRVAAAIADTTNRARADALAAAYAGRRTPEVVAVAIAAAAPAQPIAAEVISETPPANPRPGQGWVHATTGMAFVWVPPGEFTMGANNSEAYSDEFPVHQVRLTSGYWLGKYPVTNKDFRSFVVATGGIEPSSFRREGFDDPRQPVTGIDWNSAVAFGKWLTTRLPGGWHACLPTEAQWEFAARGEGGRRFPWGDEEPGADRAVFGGTPPRPVGGRPAGAGPFGAEDQAGQVWEWCQDVFERYDRRSKVEVDPRRPSVNAQTATHVLRGGSWTHSVRGIRAAARGGRLAGDQVGNVGFRVSISRERE